LGFEARQTNGADCARVDASRAGVDGTLDQPIDAAVEAQYNLRLRHPERTAIYQDMTLRSAAFRARVPAMRTLAYGALPACQLDFFPARHAGPRAPLFVFIHGGYWRALERGIFSYLAEAWLERGVHVAMPGYTLAPQARVEDIVAETGAALHTLRAEAASLGIDSERVLVSGHSAGAQLGASVLAAGSWHAAAFAGISGVYDLAPLLRTSVNHDVHLDARSARALSPGAHAPVPGVRYLCAVGAGETDGFRQQSRDYVRHLRGLRAPVRYLEVPGRNHFDILDDFADLDHALFQAVFALFDGAAD